MPRFRKRNTAVYAALFGSAIYILYTLFFDSRSSSECETSTEHRRIITGLNNDFGLGAKSRLAWGKEVPETRVVTEAPGYTVFDQLYAFKGNYVAVSNEKAMHTITKSAISSGQPPQFRVLDGFHAKHELGSSGIVLPGTTIIFNDPPGPEGYLVYPGNFVGEALLGAWKTLAICPPSKELHNANNTVGYHPHHFHHTATKQADLPVRYIFPKCGKAGTWQDPDGINAWYLTHLNPYAAIEEQGAWQARAKAGETFVFERVIIVDRRAAHAWHDEIDEVAKMSAAIAKSRLKHQDILEPWRASFFESAGVEIEPTEHPVVVYVDHQRDGRRLLQHEHDGLIRALEGLTDVAEVHVANVREMTMTEKMKLFGKTTLWMPPTNRSAVIELYDPGSYAPNMIGHRYYPIHYDEIALDRPKRRVETTGMNSNASYRTGPRGTREIHSRKYERIIEQNCAADEELAKD
ncbi:hypothetical protein QFC21_001435 [Naganishia friedmannii]|uniref:Uncharacterized protein n=1 Tax=Naganishia friedmannii TaxID=89922 RepID=A0ACC2W591_9TREE|nr:hypothetical protein QFC21_001435 [Naganishia friedmannii]